MTRYKVIGLRSHDQVERLNNQLSRVSPSEKTLRIDYSQGQLSVPDDVNMADIETITAFEQVSLRPLNEVNEAQTDHHSHHHHHHDHTANLDAGKSAERNMLIVFIINITFAVLEFVFGRLFNSAAIMSDAVHDLGDSVSVGLAWLFQKVSTNTADETYSYGYGRFSLLGAFITSLILFIGSVIMIIHSVPKLFNPEPVNYTGMFWLAIFAVIANGFAAWLLGRGKSLNESVLNLHMLEDVLGWAGVLVVSIVLRFTDWYILDPILSILIASWILSQTVPQFIKIGKIFLQAVPENIDMEKIRSNIVAVEGVQALSHLHIWSTDGQESMMTVTVTTNQTDIETHQAIKQQIRRIIGQDEISHATIELIYDPKQLVHDSIQCR